MDFGSSLTFIFEDDEWIKKILIMTVVTLIPIVGIFVLIGWAFQIAQNVRRNDPNPLPELDFGSQLRSGFMLFLGYLIYTIPLWLFACLGGLPSAFLSDSDETMATIALVLSVCFSCLSLIYGILMYFVVSAAYIRYIDSEEFSAFTGFSDNIALARENMGALLQLLLFSLLVGILVGLAGSILSICIVGPLLAQPVGQAATAHLMGQTAKRVGSATPDAPAV